MTRWLKQVGDDVAVDEPLLEISTDKVDTEIPSPVRRRAAGDPRRRGRDRRGRCRARAHRRRCRSGCGTAAEAPARRSGACRRGPGRRRSGARTAPAARRCPGTRRCSGSRRGPGRAGTGCSRGGLDRRRRHLVRDAARAPARAAAGRRPGLGHGHRRRRSHPQGGRPQGRRHGCCSRSGRRAPAPRHRSRCRRCAARRSRCRVCARSSPSVRSRRCSRPRS